MSLLNNDNQRYGYKDGGDDFPDLNKDGKVTYADILIGRGVREQKSIGGLLNRLRTLIKADKDKDIDEILDELTPAQMDKLTPTEKEQLLDLQLEKYGVDGPKIKDIDDVLDELTPAEIDKLSPLEREQLLDMELEKYGIGGRKSKLTGGLLSDDRQTYSIGKVVKKVVESDVVQKNVPGADALLDRLSPKSFRDKVKDAEDRLEMLKKEQNDIREKMVLAVDENKKEGFKGLSLEELKEVEMNLKNLEQTFKTNSKLIDSVRKELKELGINPREGMEEGGMLPDDEMEDEYLDFILDESLDSEEEDYLMKQLQGDERLSMIFDKVIEVASEFAGSGPVEGPGSGVSDSIPARLSDGEFVFTAKAAKEIGADELMRMMKDAEMKADERQKMQNGGDVEEEMVTMQPEQEPARQEIRVVKETVDSPNRMIADEDEISKSIKSNMMLDPMQRHVRS